MRIELLVVDTLADEFLGQKVFVARQFGLGEFEVALGSGQIGTR